jgi:hypothetical protein
MPPPKLPTFVPMPLVQRREPFDDPRWMYEAKWRLVVKRYRAVRGESDHAGGHEWDEVEEGVSPLLETGRDLRIAAAAQIPELLDLLKQKAEERINVGAEGHRPEVEKTRETARAAGFEGASRDSSSEAPFFCPTA